MDAATRLNPAHGRRPVLAGTAAPRLLAAIVLLGGWQALAWSGLLFRDVVPPLGALAAGLGSVLADPDFWPNALVTGGELLAAVVAGGVAGVMIGVALGVSGLVAAAFERWIAWFSPTPKIILFPVLIMLCGVGPESKVAMGAVSCFFPVALSTVAAIRGVDPVLLRVARSLRARGDQILLKVYLPATVAPMLNGARLGFGVALIGVLLAETKLSNQGIGFAVMQAYARFDMPRMYGLLILTVGFAAVVNIVISHAASRAGGPSR